MNRKTCLLLVAFALLFATLAHADPVSKEIPFTRRVRLAVPATYTFRFSLWDAADPGTGFMAWSEEAEVKLATRKLSHSLGSVTDLDGVDFSGQYWVQVERWKPKAGVWAVLGGRTMLTVVPYALWSASVDAGSVTSAEILDGSVGPGDLQDGAALAEIADDDGAGSGLDADRLDGLDSSSLARVGRYSIPGVTGGSVSIPIPHYNSFQIVIGEAFGSPGKVAWIAGVENDYEIAWIGMKPDGSTVTGTADLTTTDTVMTISPDIVLRCPGAEEYVLILTSTYEDVRAFITW